MQIQALDQHRGTTNSTAVKDIEEISIKISQNITVKEANANHDSKTREEKIDSGEINILKNTKLVNEDSSIDPNKSSEIPNPQ